VPALTSLLDTGSAAFAANAARMAGRLAEVRALEQKVRDESSSKRDRFEKRGQLLPRERVARLIDRGSDFIEFATLAGLGMHDDDGDTSVLGGGSIIGIGTVGGKRCVIMASDSAIKGGTIPPLGLKKSLRAQEIARDNRLPLVYLVESGGANLIYQSEIFIEGGRSFANQARLSAAGIPQIAIVHGASTAGGAYLPGLSDYVILVRGRSSIYLAGPPLVKAAIGEDTDEESAGRRRDPCRCHRPRRIPLRERRPRHRHGARGDGQAELGRRAPPRESQAPRYANEELLGLVPADEREPYDVREVIARLVDASDFLEFKAGYAGDTICGHARLHGHKVGILGNNGPIQPDWLGQGRTVHPALRPERHAADLPAEHHRLHGRLGGRTRRRDQARLEDDPGRGQRPRAPSSPSSSAALTAPATTACAGAASTRASSLPGPRRAPP
jgi:geranyl-CoA carboxylase beta subunit